MKLRLVIGTILIVIGVFLIGVFLTAIAYADDALDNAPLRECIASGGRPSIGTQGITCEYPDIQGHQVASSDPTGDPCPQQYEYGERELGFHLYCYGKK